MAKEKTTITVINQNHPNTIELPNSSNLPFGFRLNNTNFKIWSRMIEVHAAGLNKLGYLNGQTPKVDEMVMQSGVLRTQLCEDGC